LIKRILLNFYINSSTNLHHFSIQIPSHLTPSLISSFSKISKTFCLSKPQFTKFLINFFLAELNHIFTNLKKISSSVSQKLLCLTNFKTLDCTFGAGTKLSGETKSSSVTTHFLAIINQITLDFGFLLLKISRILSQTSFCIRITISSGLFSNLYKKCLKIGEVI